MSNRSESFDQSICKRVGCTSLIRALSVAALMVAAVPPCKATAEAVCVKYGPCPLDLSAFTCTDTARSSFVRRVCYDEPKRFMVIKLNETWYPYCAVDATSVGALLSADSVGRHYNERFRTRGSVHGPFDCRDRPIPNYK